MKFIISFLITSNVFGAPINFYFEKRDYLSNTVFNKFNQKYFIPKNLLELKKTVSCKAVKERSKLDLCVDADGELHILHADKIFIEKSLDIFKIKNK